MTVAFFNDPENRIVLQICRTSPGFVPIVVNGKLHLVREVNVSDYPVSPNLSAEDFVIGLEVIGCRFIRNENDVVMVREPTAFVYESWCNRARQIQAVMSDDGEGRRTALSDYLHARNEG